MKKVLKTTVMSFAILCLGVNLSVAQANSSEEHVAEKKAALVVAEDWLAIVDAGKVAKSWEETSDYFKKNVSESEWTKLVNEERKPLGRLNSRKVFFQQYATELPSAPDGEYVVIQFKSSFKNGKEASETVTPCKVNGEWKVTGYYIY